VKRWLRAFLEHGEEEIFSLHNFSPNKKGCDIFDFKGVLLKTWYLMGAQIGRFLLMLFIFIFYI